MSMTLCSGICHGHDRDMTVTWPWQCGRNNRGFARALHRNVPISLGYNYPGILCGTAHCNHLATFVRVAVICFS